jgi:hypothetical protein
MGVIQGHRFLLNALVWMRKNLCNPHHLWVRNPQAFRGAAGSVGSEEG